MIEKDKEDREWDDEEELEQDQCLVFKIHDQEYGMQALRVKEIASVMSLTEVPQAPVYIEGILNHRGELVSVINFRKKFGFDVAPYDEDTRVIMVEKEGHSIGLLVDGVEEVIKVPQENVHQLPESMSTPLLEDYVTGVGMMGERLIILLDADRVLAKSEGADMRQLVKEVGATMKAEKAKDRKRMSAESAHGAQP